MLGFLPNLSTLLSTVQLEWKVRARPSFLHPPEELLRSKRGYTSPPLSCCCHLATSQSTPIPPLTYPVHYFSLCSYKSLVLHNVKVLQAFSLSSISDFDISSPRFLSQRKQKHQIGKSPQFPTT